MIDIRVVSRSGVPLERLSLGVPLVARFGDAVGDIGRGADCTLVLPDANREISRRQVLVTCRGDQHYICPIGSNLVVVLNGRPLSPDVETELDVGAQIGIGPYLLRVENVVGESDATRETGVQPPLAVASSFEDPLAFFDQPTPAASSVFGDLLDTTTSSKRRASPARPAPTGRPEGRRRSTAAAPAAPAAERTSESSSAGAIEPETAPPALQAGRRAHGGARRTSQRDAAQHPTSSAEEIVDALFSGLGVPAPADAAQRAAQASIVGQMLRAAISGTLDLLAARTIAKREMGENATLLQKRENNPLKFSPDTDAALARLLAPTAHGFVAPVEAINDAFADLRAHEVGLLSGMRAALDEVLGRFDPAVLEPRLAPDALWDKLVPTNRRARLWEQYCQQYAEILREVEGDFDTLFGRAFLRAYRAQLAEFARRNRPGPRESD